MLTAGVWMIVAALYLRPERDSLISIVASLSASLTALGIILNEVFG
jgi:hypothetical protein